MAAAATAPVYSASGGAIIPQGGAPGTPIAPPVAPVAPAATASPTIGSLYGGISSSDQNVIDAANSYKGVATTPVDEEGIRSHVMDSLQSEIDATNQVYAKQLEAARVAGANLVGSTTAANARGGLTGSDFGTANTYNAGAKATADIGAVGAAQQAAIQAIIDRGQTEATNEINQKQTAQKNGADSYIGFLNAAQTRQQTRTTNAAQAALSGGLDLTSAPDATVKAIADSYQIDPAALVSSFVASKNAANTTAATLTKPIASTAGDTTSQFDPTTGKYITTRGTPTDATLKEYQYAVANNNFTGSLADWNAQKANQKVSDTVTHDPLTGALQVVQRAGPKVAGLPSSTANPSTTLPSPAAPTTSTKLPAANANPATKAPTAPVANPLDTLDGSDLAYAQTGQPSLSKFKYPGQIDAAAKRIQAVIPGWTPATAAASYAFFKSPATQQFIANSNTVLNSIALLKQLSSKVDRSQFTFANGSIIGLAAGVSDPNAAKFLQAAQIAGDEGGKLLGSAGGSDFTTQLGLSLINTKYSDPTFQTTMDQFAGRVNNKVGEYYKQAGTAAGNQTPLGTGTPKGSLSDSDFINQSLSSQQMSYQDAVSKVPSGYIGAVDNSTGQLVQMLPTDFDPSKYTKI